MIRNWIIIVPQTERVDQYKLAYPFRIHRRKLGSHHTAERVSDEVEAIQAKACEEIIVIDQQIPQAIERLEIGKIDAAGMGWGINLASDGDIIEEASPFLSERSV